MAKSQSSQWLALPDPAFALTSVRELDTPVLADFAAQIWGEDARRNVVDRWWLRCDFAAAIAAVDRATGRVAGMCVAVPSEWELPEASTVQAVSICGWFVAPDYVGRGLGKTLVRSFSDQASIMNALSISDAAVRNFTKLGWVGPFSTRLRLLPLPLLRRGRRSALGRAAGLSLQTFTASVASFPSELAKALDRIDATRPPNQLRRRRRASDWLQHLACRPRRRPRFHVIHQHGDPVGYFVIRPTDEEAGRIYRIARLHYVSDIVLNVEDEPLLDFTYASIATEAPTTAGAILMCTSSEKLADAAARAGWLHEQSPLIGSQLAQKAPLYMLGEGFVPYAGADIRLTFADSDVDLNI